MLKIIVMVAFFVCLIITTYILAYKKNKLEIAIFPQKAPVNTPIKIVLSNLKPNEQVIIEAVQSDSASQIWRSKAIFQANEAGMINLDKMAPVEGSYREVDGMGLFHSMLPDDKKVRALNAEGKNFTVVFSFYRKNELVAQKVIERLVNQ